MALKDLVYRRKPSKREIDAAIIALDALDMESNRNIENLTRVVAETALNAAALERVSMRYEAKKRKR